MFFILILLFRLVKVGLGWFRHGHRDMNGYRDGWGIPQSPVPSSTG